MKMDIFKKDFSKQSRNRLNLAFSSLRNVLETSNDWGQSLEWKRFLIIERTTNMVVKVIIGELGHCQVKLSSLTRKHTVLNRLNNKELCAKYRKNLNERFDYLRRVIEDYFTVRKIDSNTIKLARRCSISIEAINILTRYYIQSTSYPTPMPLKLPLLMRSTKKA